VYTHDFTPPDWAQMQISLGEALALPDKRESNTEGLEQGYDVDSAGDGAAECLAANFLRVIGLRIGGAKHCNDIRLRSL